MTAHTFVALDYVVLISLLVLSAGIGVLFAWRDRRRNNNRQFLTANRELSWLPVSLSMMASFLSSTSVLGLPSEVFVRGSTMWTGAIGTTLAILMAAFIFMPMYYKMDITSINEGGIKAVVWTDVVQVILIYVAYIMVIACLMPYIVQDLLYEYPGLCGLMAAAVYSSSLSTLSSGYNSLAAVTWEDFLRPCMKRSESSALRITKVTERNGSDDVNPSYVYPPVRKYMRGYLIPRNDSQSELKEALSANASSPKELKALILEHDQYA
ncbi:hypothetical protein HPB50_013040 [Hyalomma asiaticum]|uniref:Uncharacterized protein n=1 Tax=Hyalomma asiaticum TaxID=266040 RepID=A0ACB7RZ86_HYAAI|nr:hypothetical protein HPB50_013040 [Hyalomma asiaticum]